jgi:mRNA interferase MazF
VATEPSRCDRATGALATRVRMRVDIEASPATGLRVASQVMVDWPQKIRLTEMGQVIGRVDTEALRAVTRQLAIVLGIGGTGKPRRLA